VVEEITLVVWGLCFGKVGGVISCPFDSVRGIVGRRHSVSQPLLSQPPVFMLQSFMFGGLGSVCYILIIYAVLYGVLCEFKYALSNSLFGGPEL
jgi:hypothetical protein